MSIPQLGTALLAGLLGASLAEAEPRFDVIEPLPGRSHSRALAISDDGCVVVGHSDETAIRWREGVTSLLVDDSEQNPRVAYAISGDGRVVGGTLVNGRAFKLLNGQPVQVTSWSGAVTGLDTNGYAYVGYGDIDGAGHIYPFFFTTPQFWLPAGSLGRALTISRDGLVAGGWSWQSPALWPASGGSVELPVLQGHVAGAVHALSSDGSVAAGFTTGYAGQSEPRAVRWNGGAIEDLGPLARIAHAISGDGSLVVGEGPEGAFIWDGVHGARLLADVLRERYGVDPGSFQLLSATAMAPDGRSFAGHGVDTNGSALGWRVRLLETHCAEAAVLEDLLADYDGESALDGLTDLAVDTQGRAYTNSDTRVVRVDPGDASVFEVLNLANDGGAPDSPRILGMAPDDAVYVGASARHQLLRISPQGGSSVVLDGSTYPYVPPWPNVPTSPRELAIAPDGTLFVAADARLLRIDPDGATTELMNANQATWIGRGSQPQPHSYSSLDDIALTRDGRLFLTLGSSVLLELDPISGAVLRESRGWPPALGYVRGVIPGADGDLWLYGEGLGRLRGDGGYEIRFKAGRIPDGTGGTWLQEIYQLVGDEHGNVYYVGAGSRWLRLTPHGSVDELLGQSSRYENGQPPLYPTPRLVTNGALYGIDDRRDYEWGWCGDYDYGSPCEYYDPSPPHIVRLDLPAETACTNGLDDDGDGLVDFPDDPGCLSPEDEGERSFDFQCDDGIDNDHDGVADFPADPGCVSLAAPYEKTECDDGLDNDGDGAIDWDGRIDLQTGIWLPPDPECQGNPRIVIEHPWYCGLGFEVALVVLPLTQLARARRRARAAQQEM